MPPVNGEHEPTRLELVSDVVSPEQNPEHHQDIGYTLIPSQTEEGFFSPASMMNLPKAYLRGLGKAASALSALQSSDHNEAMWPEPEKVTVSVYGRNQMVLVTEPDPKTKGDSDETVNNVLLNGLTEMADCGSARSWHREVARRHPDRRTITLPTPSVSHSGHHLSIIDSYRRTLEETANENLHLIPKITGNAPINLVGVSLGSYVATLMAEQNLAANEHSQVNMSGLRLVSPAVGARNVSEDESFRNISDDAFVEEMKDRFFKHMPIDVLRMAVKHPEELAECMAILGAYALGPHKLPNRLAAIVGGFNGVAQGIEWSTIKHVAEEYETHVLGGEHDPLVQEQIPQWQRIKKTAPRTLLWVVQGAGHAMTVNARGTADHLARMEHARAA